MPSLRSPAEVADMSYLTVTLVYARSFLLSILAAFTARPAAALVSGFNVHLLRDSAISLNSDTVRADLLGHECGYSGYAPQVVSTWVTVRTPNGEALAANSLFVAGSAAPFVTDSAAGYWIDDGTNFLFGEYFAGGLHALFPYAGTYLDLNLLLPIQGQLTA